MAHDEKSIKDILRQFEGQDRMKWKLNQIKVQNAWNQRFLELQKYTRLVKLDGDLLIIELTSGPLLNELSYNKDKIINELNEYMGEPMIKRLILR